MPGLVILLVIWAVLAMLVASLAIYRRRIYVQTDELLHVLDAEAPLISSQEANAKRLEKIDFWGKTLTIIVVLYGFAIGGLYLYGMLIDTSIKM